MSTFSSEGKYEGIKYILLNKSYFKHYNMYFQIISTVVRLYVFDRNELIDYKLLIIAQIFQCVCF